MPINPQTQSAFVTRLVALPAEIRDAIYLELWRSCGLRQHILWHGEKQEQHFCSWPCSTEFGVDDVLQREIEKVRCRLGVALGEDIGRYDYGFGNPEIKALNRRLQSTWMNHCECGERAFMQHDLKAISGSSTSTSSCWKKNWPDENWSDKTNEHVPSWSPYLPMLLSCKLLSEQCLKSIYESTTFVFTDPTALQMFLGTCQPHLWPEGWSKTRITPPSFYKYARTLEVSLSADFPDSLLCVKHDLRSERRHKAYDFHWLRLDRFQNLHSLNIWISARANSATLRRRAPGYPFTGITELDADALEQVLSHLNCVPRVTLSTPLAPSVGPEEEGFVEGFKACVYKRGDGDRFHPPLYWTRDDHTFISVIKTSIAREIRLARSDSTHILMKKV